MIPVEQRQLWRPDDHPDGPQRGDCLRACVASIFELPYEEIPANTIEGDRRINEWLSTTLPGVAAQYHYLRGIAEPETLDSWREWPQSHYEPGYWIAAVKSPRIPDVEEFGCGCVAQVPGGDPECEWCGGKPETRSMGIRWGLHAVVMRHGRCVWDPHPERSDTVGPFAGATTFRAVDPGALRRASASAPSHLPDRGGAA